MFRKTLYLLGVTLLTVSLGVAFLSEDGVFVRTRTNKSTRLGGKSGQVSGSGFSLSDSKFKTDESSGGKDLEELSNSSTLFASSRFLNLFASEETITASRISNILSDQYLNLPPPV